LYSSKDLEHHEIDNICDFNIWLGMVVYKRIYSQEKIKIKLNILNKKLII
jgi:hypothetical protein